MPKGSNVRSKTPRPLAGEDRTPDRGLAHGYRWGTVSNGTPLPPPQTSSQDDTEAPSSRSVGMTHANRWGLTPSTIAPESLKSRPHRDAARNFDATPTPPPVAVTLEAPASRRGRDGEQAPHAAASDDIATANGLLERPRWQSVAVASFVAAALIAAVAVLRQARHVEVAQGSVVAQIETVGTVPAPPGDPSAAPLAESAAPRTIAEPTAPMQPKTGSFSVTYDGHVPIDGGVLHIPNTFRPREGGYDLVIHFHGDVRIVRESVERANVNAVLAIVNWGIRSVPYRDIYKETGRFERLLAQIHQGIGQRGFKNLELRRMALTAWSGGYGAIESILETRLAPDAENDPLDAIILLDGIHAAFVDEDHNRLAEVSVLPFLRAARAAANDRIMFTLTHSEIDPVLYASSKRSAEMLLTSVGVRADKTLGTGPQHLKLKAAQQSIGRDTMLQPTTETRVGSLHVTGFRGITPEAHAAHLLQMGAIALPELAARWTNAAPVRVHPVLSDDGTEHATDRKLPPGSTVLSQPPRPAMPAASSPKGGTRADLAKSAAATPAKSATTLRRN